VVVQLLLAKGADVNAKTTEKDTYLLIAASIGNIEIMQQLLAAGANVDCKNKIRMHPSLSRCIPRAWRHP